MIAALLVRGMLAGLLAGLLACGAAWLFGEPQIALAIGFEAHLHQMAGEAPEPELVSRAVQSTLGLATGIMIYACALGGIFALVFAYAYGRVGRIGPRAVAVLLALAGFVALILVPQVKYPANPPSIGEPETIGFRTALYFTMIALSVASAVAASSSAAQLARRWGAWNAVLPAGLAYLAAAAAAMLILPPVDEVPGDFPATVLWNFRLASLGIELVLWATLGLVFGFLADRRFAAARATPLRLARRARSSSG